MEIQNEKIKPQSPAQRLISKTIIISVVFFGFWIGWDVGAYGYIKYLTYVKETQGVGWMNQYRDILRRQQEANKKDFYGGDTPEQTIDLFIEALKKEDYELAVKYFEVQEQSKWEESFATPNRKNIEEWISELEVAKKTWHKNIFSDGDVEFWYDIKEGEPSRDINLSKNINNKWKIESL